MANGAMAASPCQPQHSVVEPPHEPLMGQGRVSAHRSASKATHLERLEHREVEYAAVPDGQQQLLPRRQAPRVRPANLGRRAVAAAVAQQARRVACRAAAVGQQQQLLRCRGVDVAGPQQARPCRAVRVVACRCRLLLPLRARRQRQHVAARAPAVRLLAARRRAGSRRQRQLHLGRLGRRRRRRQSLRERRALLGRQKVGGRDAVRQPRAQHARHDERRAAGRDEEPLVAMQAAQP